MAAAALTDLWRAAQVFSLALKLDGSNHVLFSNRSAAHLALGHTDKALDDAEAALRLKPDWPKGFLRKGDALLGSGSLKGAHEAVEVYMQGVAVAEGKATDGIWSISGIVDIHACIDITEWSISGITHGCLCGVQERLPACVCVVPVWGSGGVKCVAGGVRALSLRTSD